MSARAAGGPGWRRALRVEAEFRVQAGARRQARPRPAEVSGTAAPAGSGAPAAPLVRARGAAGRAEGPSTQGEPAGQAGGRRG